MASFLGGLEQARAVLFYLLKYLTKRSGVPHQLPLSHQLRLGKPAKPTIPPRRTLVPTSDLQKHLLLSGMTELADTQIAQDSSAKTTFVFIHNAIAAVKARVPVPADVDMEMMEREIDPQEGGEEVDDHDTEDETSLFQPTQLNPGWGGAPIYRVTDDAGEERNVVVPQDLCYAHRGIELEELNLLEYACLIETIQRKKKDDKEEGAAG